MLLKVVSLLLLCIQPTLTSKIYDCFPIFNENEILKLHLAELYESVDYFVIVEGTETFSGLAKDLYFPTLASELTEFMDKIIYIPVEYTLGNCSPWMRESYQRNQILRGLDNATPDDYVIISDADEIIKPDHIQQILHKLGDREMIGIGCDFYQYFLNRKRKGLFLGPVVSRVSSIREHGADIIRGGRSVFYYEGGAWHFSNMGGVKMFIDKLASFSHFEECRGIKDELIEDASAYSKQYEALEIVPIDSSFPAYVLENYEKLVQAGLIN